MSRPTCTVPVELRAGRDGWAVTLAEYNPPPCRIIPRGLPRATRTVAVFSNDIRLQDCLFRRPA